MSTQVPFTMDEQFRMSEVKRWHVINTAREQTLADHSFQVAMVLNHMVSWAYDCGDYWTREDAYFLLMAGLLHDAHEVWIGDRPTCAKKFGETSKHQTSIYLRAIKGISRRRAVQAEQWVAFADTMEALVWLNQNQVGSHAATVVSELLARCRSNLETLDAPSAVKEEIIHYLKKQGLTWE